MHPRIRADARVTVLERFNVRGVTTADTGGPVDIVVADLSFISLRQVVVPLSRVCVAGAPMVLLVKPQFEAGRQEVSRGKGVVADPLVHERVRGEVADALIAAGCVVRAWTTSPLTGADGNREFLVHATAPEEGSPT